MRAHRLVGLLIVSCLLFLPAAAWAQQASATIAGVVKDTSGAVMPGVTVEAASPALVEKVRNVVSRTTIGNTRSWICGPAATSSPSPCPASARSSGKASS